MRQRRQETGGLADVVGVRGTWGVGKVPIHVPAEHGANRVAAATDVLDVVVALEDGDGVHARDVDDNEQSCGKERGP